MLAIEGPTSPASIEALRRRIGLLCRTLRLAAPLYAAWVLITVVVHWTDPEAVARVYGAWLRVELGNVAPWQRAAGFAVHFVIWTGTAAACLGLWRLFSGFLAGAVFTRGAAATMRRIALFGLAAQVGDMVTRPLISLIVTAHMPVGSRMVGVFFDPHDLLDVMFLAGFLALGHVFTVASEIAEDNAAIV